MISIPDLLYQSLEKVLTTFTHTWPFLIVSILISVGLRLYVHPGKVSSILTRYQRVGVIGATVVAVGTPLCSGGTTAVILGMMANTIPWAPIVAFMVASPLTSPEELVYSAGLFGWPFAIAFFVASILLGLMGGFFAEFFEARGWLANQARFAAQPVRTGAAKRAAKEPQAVAIVQERSMGSNGLLTHPITLDCDNRAIEPRMIASHPLAFESNCDSSIASLKDSSSCSGPVPASSVISGCGTEADPRPVTPRRWMEEIYRTSKQLMVMFLGFAFLGYVLNGLIPPAWVTEIFGTGNAYSVPLAATLGLPLYINSEGSLPLVRALIDNGMSQGAALAFLITGAGTSVGAVAGALTIARWRVLALVVGTLWIGAVVFGYTYDLLLAMHLL